MRHEAKVTRVLFQKNFNRVFMKNNLVFIDWMKASGLFLIVYGHVAGATIPGLTPPIYTKQLGVAFFLFVMGFTIARDPRPAGEVVVRRLFDVYAFGIAFALLMSGVTFARNADLAESNYLPFLGGINVLLNHFPANPTTWFIGTYFHAVFIGSFLLRRIEVRGWMIVVTAVCEVAVRVMLSSSAGLFVAYMVLPNWATVMLIGVFFGQRKSGGCVMSRRAAPMLTLALLMVGLPFLLGPMVSERSFPFMRLEIGGDSAIADAVATSASVTFVYLAFTWSVYRVALTLPDLGMVRFIARNTLIVFVAHMPLYYGLQSLMGEWDLGYPEKVSLQFLLCFVALAVASEIFLRMLGFESLSRGAREHLVAFLGGRRVQDVQDAVGVVAGKKTVTGGIAESSTPQSHPHPRVRP